MSIYLNESLPLRPSFSKLISSPAIGPSTYNLMRHHTVETLWSCNAQFVAGFAPPTGFSAQLAQDRAISGMSTNQQTSGAPWRVNT
jgi:hypothetical protein